MIVKYHKWGRFAGLIFHIFHGFQEYCESYFREDKCLSLIILNNKHFWPRKRESISATTSMGLKLQTFSPANLSMSTVGV